jgi:hypothetical protein
MPTVVCVDAVVGVEDVAGVDAIAGVAAGLALPVVANINTFAGVLLFLTSLLSSLLLPRSFYRQRPCSKLNFYMKIILYVR